MSQWKGIVSICTAYLPYRYVERWGGCADECHEIVIWQASPRCGINSLSHLSLMSWTDIYRVTRCVLGRSGVTAAGIYALRLLKAGCASSAVGSLRPLCDGFRVWIFHIDCSVRITDNLSLLCITVYSYRLRRGKLKDRQLVLITLF